MKKQDINEDVSAKLNTLSADTQKNWTALNVIAARLGMMIDEKGEYVMESDGVDIPIFECKASDGTANVTAQQPEMDVDTVATTVWEKFRDNQLPVKLGDQSIRIDIKSLVEGNEWLREAITGPWNDWYKKYFNAFAKLHGYTVIEVGDEIVLKVDDTPMIPPNPYRDDSPSEPTDKPEAMPSSLRGLLAAVCRRIWQDAVSCFWKTFAYIIAYIGIIFGIVMWWQGKQETKQMEKQYLVYRYFLEADPKGYTIPPSLDKDIKNYGLDDVLNHYKQKVENQKSSQHFEEIMQKEAERKKLWQRFFKEMKK